MELVLETGGKLSTVNENVASISENVENEADRLRKRETFRRAF